MSEQKKEYVLSKQLLRSGTSIGANLREAEYAQSKPDFIHKLSIALKEANGTGYWLSLLFDSNFILKDSYDSISEKCTELIKIIIASIDTAKSNH